MAALGPKNVRMTAEVADGWLPLFYLPEKVDDVWGDDLAAGAADRSADLAPLEIVAGGLLAVGDDAASIRDLARPMIALYVGGMGARGRNFYNDLAWRYGFEAEAKEIQDLYLDGQKDEAAAAVPDGLLEAATICGPEGYVRDRIAAFKEAGVTSLNVTPLAEDVPAPGHPAQGVGNARVSTAAPGVSCAASTARSRPRPRSGGRGRLRGPARRWRPRPGRRA